MNKPPAQLQLGRRGTDLSALARQRSGDVLQQIPLDHIEPQADFNPRGRVNPNAFEPERLAGLAQSIRADGVLQPLLVRPLPGQSGRYTLIAGERRWRASQLNAAEDIAAGRPVQRPTISALVRELDDQLALELAVVENAQREDLDLVEESLIGLELLKQRTSMSAEQLRSHLVMVRKDPALDQFELDTYLRRLYGTGVSVWSQKRVKVLDLTDEERTAVMERRIPFQVAIELIKATGKHREQLLKRAIEEQLSATDLRRLIQQPVASTSLATQVQVTRKLLPKLEKLQGQAAKRAEELLSELQKLVNSK